MPILLELALWVVVTGLLTSLAAVWPLAVFRTLGEFHARAALTAA